jgi:hypothetical protein
MCRSSSPLFGDPIFRRCSRDEFERRLRQMGHFAMEMGSGARTYRLDLYETVEMGEV